MKKANKYIALACALSLSYSPMQASGSLLGDLAHYFVAGVGFRVGEDFYKDCLHPVYSDYVQPHAKAIGLVATALIIGYVIYSYSNSEKGKKKKLQFISSPLCDANFHHAAEL